MSILVKTACRLEVKYLRYYKKHVIVLRSIDSFREIAFKNL